MTTAPLDVKVIYDASATRGRRGAVVTRTGVAQSRWLIVGMINLLCATVLCYGAWWRVDSEILYPKLLMHSTIPGVDLNALAEMLAKSPTPASKPGKGVPKVAPRQSAPSRPSDSAAKSPGTKNAVASRSVDSRTIQLWGGAYVWLTLAGIATCALGLSSGSLIGRWRGDSIKLAGRILTGAALIGLGLSVFAAYNKYGMEYPIGHLRLTMGGLGALFFFGGLGVAGHVRGLARLAAGALILSAIGSVAGLFLWSRLGAIPPEQASLTFLLMVFAVHSAWGWILWVVAPRLPR